MINKVKALSKEIRNVEKEIGDIRDEAICIFKNMIEEANSLINEDMKKESETISYDEIDGYLYATRESLAIDGTKEYYFAYDKGVLIVVMDDSEYDISHRSDIVTAIREMDICDIEKSYNEITSIIEDFKKGILVCNW